jgi:hypothetical protein
MGTEPGLLSGKLPVTVKDTGTCDAVGDCESVGEREAVPEADDVLDGAGLAEARGDRLSLGLGSAIRVRRIRDMVGVFVGGGEGVGVRVAVGDHVAVSVGAGTEIASETPSPIAP